MSLPSIQSHSFPWVYPISIWIWYMYVLSPQSTRARARILFHRGITLTSVLAEFVLLDRILPILANIPQVTQTAFQKDVSCLDVKKLFPNTFAKEILSIHVFMIWPLVLTMEYLVKPGIVGRTWRLIKEWNILTPHQLLESAIPPPEFSPGQTGLSSISSLFFPCHEWMGQSMDVALDAG